MRNGYLDKIRQHVGKTFYNLTILNIIDKLDSSGRIMCLCRCSCGNKKEFAISRVISGHNRSCGECGYRLKRINESLARDISGMRSGKLVALYPTNERSPDKQIIWMCRCDCGNMVKHKCGEIVQQTVKSCNKCGYSSQRTIETFQKYHTAAEQNLSERLSGMKDRCYNPHSDSFRSYGQRGIYICDEWLADPRNFIDWALANGYSPELTLERNDLNGPYAPWNCTWIPREQQAYNKQNTHWTTLIYNGKLETKCLAEWCKILNVDYTYLNGRSETDVVDLLTKVIDFGSLADYDFYKENCCDENGNLLSDDELFKNTWMSDGPIVIDPSNSPVSETILHM